MTVGLRAVRRLVLLLAALTALSASPVSAAAAGVQSSNPYGTLGHARLSVNSNLRSASHISAWSIDAYLVAHTPLPRLGHAFKTAETKYNVNALYLLAHAMHESAFGTSYIARRFHNLFGWNAADRNPIGLAKRFRTFAKSVDYVARRVAERYLTPGARFYGGAATLRGMRHYASDPYWAWKIARIANRIVLSTLAARGITFGDPEVGDLSTGQTSSVTVKGSGRLPDGIRAAYRFVPVAIVEAGTATGKVPPADPGFRLGEGATRDGKLRLRVTAPSRPGRYRLELVLRDSDGTVLTEYDVPAIPDSAVRVYGSDAVTYGLGSASDGMTITVTNVGRRIIPTAGAGGPATVTTDPAQTTTLSAWLIADDGTPTIQGRAQLDHDLQPGDEWTATLPAPNPDSLPAILLVQLQVGGDPGRLGGSPPGVFRLTVNDATRAGDGSANAGPAGGASAAPSPDPTGSLDPAGGSGTSATSEPAPQADPGEADATVPLEFAAITPADATTRLLLDPGWKPPVPSPPTGTTVTGTASPTARAATPVLRLGYLAVVNPRTPGRATLRITNLGTIPIVGPVATETTASPATSGTPGDSSASGSAVVAGAAGVAAASPAIAPAPPPGDSPGGPGAVLDVTAIPAWGPAQEPFVFRLPLPAGVAPGEILDLQIALPATQAGQSTYLVAARVVNADGTTASLTVFWLRNAVQPPLATAPSAPASGR